MSDTVLEQPLVRWYLRELDRASLSLPAAQARELREQIAAHLEEALPPGASAEQVGDELDRLGSARSLVAEAAGPAPRRLATRARIRLGHVRWWAWAVIAVLVLALGTAAALLISMNSAPGQRQGIVVDLVNESDWTQQIVAIGPQWTFGSPPGTAQVSVEGGPGLNQVGVTAAGSPSGDYTSPGFIPPHSVRRVHVSWTSSECFGAGSGIVIDDITLQVRVGVITRSENIPLQRAFELTGPKHSITRDCD